VVKVQGYDHNFLRFLPITVGKIGVFLKNHQCYDPIFAKTISMYFEQKSHFWRKYLKRYHVFSPNKSSPNESSPNESSPNESSPNESSPNESSPNESSPNEGSPKNLFP
jgi:hypothetical protein